MENNRNFENEFEGMNEHKRTVYPNYTQSSTEVFEETPVQEENVYTVQGTSVHDYFSNQDTAPIPNVKQKKCCTCCRNSCTCSLCRIWRRRTWLLCRRRLENNCSADRYKHFCKNHRRQRLRT